MRRPLRYTILILFAACASPAHALADDAPPYWPAAALRAEAAAVSPDPFTWAPAAKRVPPAPARPDGPVPSNVAHLSLQRPYLLDGPIPTLALSPRNPFDPNAPDPAPAAAKTAEAHPVRALEPSSTAWDALEAAWETDPITVRRLFREETKVDWPVTTMTGPRAEANRLAAALWVRKTWDGAVRRAAQDRKRGLGPGSVTLAAGPVDPSLTFLAVGDAANGHAPRLAPRLTENPDINRHGVGFLVRLTADLGDRIPAPTLDLSGLPAGAAPWAIRWLDDAARNGIQGLTLIGPPEGADRDRVLAAVEPLRSANIYLPPPSEVGVLVSLHTATLEPGAWVSTFRAYAALRNAGVWPNLVSDDSLSSNPAALGRYRVLVVPAAKWARRSVVEGILAWVERGGTLVVSDPHAFSRAEDGWDTSPRTRKALGWEGEAFAGDGVEHRSKRGRIVTLGRVLAPGAAPPAKFWAGLLRDRQVPPRPWLESVTLANLRQVSGAYRKPE